MSEGFATVLTQHCMSEGFATVLTQQTGCWNFPEITLNLFRVGTQYNSTYLANMTYEIQIRKK